MMIPIKTKAYLKIFCSIFSPPFLIIRHGGAAVLNNYDNGCIITLIHNGTILFDKGLPSSKKKKDPQGSIDLRKSLQQSRLLRQSF